MWRHNYNLARNLTRWKEERLGMHNYVCLFTEDFRNGVVDGLNRLDHVGLGHRGELDSPIDRPHLVRELRLREGRKGPVGVRGQVLDGG